MKTLFPTKSTARGMAAILEENEFACLNAGPEAGPLLFAFLEACRRGTDRWDEADFREWRTLAAERIALAQLTQGDVPEDAKPLKVVKRG